MKRGGKLPWICVGLLWVTGFACTTGNGDEAFSAVEEDVEPGGDAIGDIRSDKATDTESDSSSDAEDDTVDDTALDTQSETGTEHDLSSDSIVSIDTLDDTETDSEYETHYDSDTDSCADTCPCCDDTESESEVDTCMDTETDTSEDSESETEVDTCMDTETDTSEDSESETEVDTSEDSESETEVDTSEDSESETVVDTGFDTDPESLCTNTGGEWVVDSCTGHWVCGFPPICAVEDLEDVIIPGCDCGPGMMFNPFTGCGSSTLCTALDCDDLGGLNTDFGRNVTCPLGHGVLGWYVRDGSCEPADGCPTIGGGIEFFGSRDACNTTCDTPQKQCMTTGGVWMIEPACDNYDCGVADEDSCSEGLLHIVCNCGPAANFAEGVGCQVDPSCPPSSGGSCPTYDFGTDYDPTCGPMPLVGHYGLRNGIPCGTIFGCPADFDPITGFISPEDWYDNLQECMNDCAGCSSDNDCDTIAGEFCQFSQGTNCGAWGTGTCATPDAVCAQVYDPVCGCNGDNVSSLCHLNSGQGNSLAYDGECFSFPGF